MDNESLVTIYKPPVLSSPATNPKKLVAIGDIHGRYDALQSLFGEAIFADGYRVVFLGDYVGYGKQNKEVLQYIVYLQKKYPQQVFALWGNWEEMMYQALFNEDSSYRDDYIKVMRSRGFENEFKKLKNDEEIRSIVQQYPESLRKFFIDGTFCFSHAGVNVQAVKQQLPLEEITNLSSLDDLLWDSGFTQKMVKVRVPYTFVIGHVPVQCLCEEVDVEQKHSSLANVFLGITPTRIPSKNVEVKPFVVGNVIGIDFGSSRKKGFLGYIKFDENGKRTYRKVPSII